MSDNLPLEIQVEIMKKLPVKSLIQFRSVSKTCKSLIDSSRFISSYSGQATHLLVSNEYGYYASFVDDHTFPQHKVTLTAPQFFGDCFTIGCSHGLVCLHNDHHYNNVGHGRTKVTMAFIWSLSIRKVVAVVVPNVDDGVYKTVLGFGVCCNTFDPKIVKITYITKMSDIETVTSIPWQVEVFQLSTRAWRNSYNNLPRKSIAFDELHQNVVLDGFNYWLACDRRDHENKTYSLIILFDMTSEEFGEIHLPRCLAHKTRNLSVSKLMESLVVLEQGGEENNLVFTVWMMEDGVTKSFTKLFSASVNTPDVAAILGFRNNGSAIIEFIDDYEGKLVVYEPYSKHIYNLGIDGKKFFFSVCSYKETLLLLDHPHLTVYNGNKTLQFEDDLSQEQLQQLLI